MIYIVEGTRGNGKTTFAQKMSTFKQKKLMLDNIDKIKQELEANKNEDVVYDRLFLNTFVNKPKEIRDRELFEINDYLSSLDYIICYKYIGSREAHIQKWKDSVRNINKLPFDVSQEYDNYIDCFKILTVFKYEETNNS